MKLPARFIISVGLIFIITGAIASSSGAIQASPGAGSPPAQNSVIGQPGATAVYHHDKGPELGGSMVATFTLALGDIEKSPTGDHQWISLSATKVNGEHFRVDLLSAGYPAASLKAAQSRTLRYLFQEDDSPTREYRNALTGEAVLPSVGGWEYLIPRAVDGATAAAEVLPAEVRYLGQRYIRQSLSQGAPVLPPADVQVTLVRPDVWIGQVRNRRLKDETRRYDGSDYEYVLLTRDDYRQMAQAGINFVNVNAEQRPWAEELGLYYWGGNTILKYPESLYRSLYLGTTFLLDEPAVLTRGHVLQPKLKTDEAFRKSISPQAAFEAFRQHFATQDLKRNPADLLDEFAARPDVNLGDMHFSQADIFSWDSFVETAAYQLSQDPHVPAVFVYEPAGKIGTRRILPEMDMTFGVQFRPDDIQAFTSILYGFLRGAARLTDKSWGISVYGQTQQEDTFWWFTHAYDLGATRFMIWDYDHLAAVPYGEILALSRHLRTYANMHPRRNLDQLTHSADVAIVLPAGYNMGHTFMGKGPLWGIDELNLERTNHEGIKYRVVMSNFFTEVERCVKLGAEFDLFGDFPGLHLKGYREIIHIREDGKVEVNTAASHTVLAGPRVPPRASGTHPELTLSVSGKPDAEAEEVSAVAHLVEKSTPVYYTLGAARDGTVYNARVAWELYGPEVEDHRFLTPEGLIPAVSPAGSGWDIKMAFKISQPGHYRLRAATVDVVGRSTVVWKSVVISKNPTDGQLRLH